MHKILSLIMYVASNRRNNLLEIWKNNLPWIFSAQNKKKAEERQAIYIKLLFDAVEDRAERLNSFTGLETEIPNAIKPIKEVQQIQKHAFRPAGGGKFGWFGWEINASTEQ